MARGTVAVWAAGLLLAVLAAVASWPTAMAQEGPPWTPIHEPGYCVWYGECGREPQYGRLNCVYNGPAKPVRPRPWSASHVVVDHA